MAKYLQLPNGDSLKVPDSMSYEEAMATAQSKFPELFSTKPKQDTSGLKAAASAGLTRLGGEAALTLGKLGFKDKAEAEKEYRAAQAKAQERFTPTEKGWTEDFGLKFRETLGGSIPSMVAPAAAGIAALALPVAAPVAIGAGLLGAGAVSAGQFTGSNLARQMETGKTLEETSGAAAVGAAIPQALIDTAAMALLPGVGKLFGSVGSKLTTEQAKAIASQTLAKTAADYAAKTGTAMGREGLTEVAQQSLERIQAGLEIADPEARKEYIESFIGGAVLGGALAPAGRYIERSGAKSQAAKAEREERNAAAKAAAEQERIAAEQEEARKNTPEYALNVANNLQTLEQEKLALQGQIRKITKDSTTEAEDKAFNKDIQAQLKQNSIARNELAPEVNRLKKSGLYQQALEQERIAGLTPEEYMLEQTKTVSNKPVKAAEPDLEGYYEQQILVPGEERRKAEEAERARVASLPAAYAAERVELARTQTYEPTAQDYADYLLQDPYKAALVVETKTPLPGLTDSESRLIRNDVAKKLKAMSKEELAARQADLQAQTLGKERADPMAAFMEQSDTLDTDRRQGVTDADIAFTERQAAMPREVIAQGELFGEPQRVDVAQRGTKLQTIPEQLAALQVQLDAARAARNTEATGRRPQYTEAISNIVEQMRLLKEQQARGEGRASTEFGAQTAGLQEQLGTLPEDLQKQQDAVQARIAATQRLADAADTEAQQDVLSSLVAEIEAARGKLKPETITEIERQAAASIAQARQTDEDYTSALDALSNQWRAGTRAGQTFTRTATPTSTSEDMLREQMDRAFAQNDQSTRTERRERYAPEDTALLNQIADNFKAFTADPERRNLAGEWLNRLTTTGRSSPEMTRDLQAELARLEEGKLQENGQLDLPERFMPKEIEGKKPEKKATVFGSAAEFQKYLASDALKVLRQTKGLAKDTASRTHARIEVFRKKVDAITAQLANLEKRKQELQSLRGVESNTARDLLNTAEANLKKVYERLDAELAGLQADYIQARQQFDFTAQTVEDIGQKIADNLAQFQSTDTALVDAAQKTADAKTVYADAIQQPVSKRTFSALRQARRGIITALESQITASRKANADETLLAFLNADLSLQLQLQAEEKVLDQDAQALLNAGLALEEAATTQKRSRKNQKELKQAQQELAAALEIKGAVATEMADLDAQIAGVEKDIGAAEKQLSRTQAMLQKAETKQENTFAAKLDAIKIEPLSAEERAANQRADKQKLENFQKSTAALAALPGQRIDFSKRQEMLELLRVSTKDSDRIAADIKDIETGIEEMQIQVAIAEEMLVEEKVPEKVAALNKKISDGNSRIAALRASLGNYEKAKARKLVEENKARVLLSGDPEVTQDIDKRIDKLVANIQNQEELAKQTVSPKTGKPLSEETKKDRAKTLARYKRELQVLTGVRSNRLGIKRIDVATGETVGKSRKPRAGAAQQEQMDAEVERVQAYGVAKDRLATMQAMLENMRAAKEPRGKAKQAERAEKIRDLQDKVNAQQSVVDGLAPRAAGKVSQVARVQSSAPGKFRAGTAETKAEAGISKRPVVESRAAAQPTAKAAVADANAFADRLSAAKTEAQRTKLMLEQDEVTRIQLEDALYDNVQYLQNRVLLLEQEREQLKGAQGMTAVTRLAQVNKELTGETAAVGDLETSGLYSLLNKAKDQLASFEKSLAEAEAKEAAAEDAERAEYGAYITELGSFEGGSEISGFDIGVEADGDFDFDARYRVAKTSGPSMSVAQVQKVYDALTGKWTNKPQTVVVADEKGLPVRILNQAKRDGMLGKIPGLYDPKSGKVYLVASNLRSVNDVILTTVHEIAGHFGLQSILGDTYAKTMTDIYNGNAAIRKAANAKMKQIKSLDQNTAVEEALAEQAELDPNAPDTRSAMRRIYDTVKKFLRDVLGLKDTVTDAQVNQLIANARRFVIEGGEAGKGAAGVITPSYRSKVSAPADALEELALKTTQQPKTLKERVGSNLALEAEMRAVDMRAGLRDTLKFGDDSLFTQAMYHVRKAEQKMAQMFTVMNSGPLVAYKDSKGFVGYRSSNENSAREVFDAIADVPKKDPQMKMDVAQMYMVAQRANNKGLSKLDLGELKIEQADLDAALAAADADPALKDALENVRRKYNAYNKGMIEFLASTGRISKKAAADMLKEGDYVPYYRVKDGNATLHFGNNVTFNVGDIRRQPYLAELKGGQTKLLPLNEAIQQNTLLLTDMALTNNAAKSVAYGLQALGKGKGPIDPATGKPTDRMAIKRGFGPDDAKVIRFYQEPDPNKPDDDGKRHIVVDTKGTLAEGIPAELVVQSMEGASLALPGFLKLGGVAADWLRAGVTRTPLYIARKLLREPMAAAFTGGLNNNAFSAVFKAGAEFVRMSRGTSDMQAKLIEKGLIQSNIFAGDMSDMKKMALQLASGKDQNVFEKVFAAADRYAMRADAATLALVLNNAEANGLSEVEADMMTMESMNFYKRGLSPTLQYASRLIPFFNAQIQGLNVLIKAARGNMPFEEQQEIKRKFYNNALLLTFTGLVYAMAMEDDETFRNARPRDKYSNFFLPIPGVDEPLKLPIPFEAGYFYSLAVAAVDSMRAETDGKAQWQAIRDLFLGSIPGYSSMGMPQIIKPALEVWTNKNFLTGGEVESRRLQGKDVEERYLATTTELAKQMSQAVPILSPIQIEHLVRGYFGVLPLVAVASANSLFEREGKGERAEGRASDLPLIGTAFQKKYGGGDADVVYREAQEAMQARNTFNDMLKEGRREDALAYREKNRAALAVAPAAGQYRQVVGRINAEVRRIQERNDMTPAEKRLRLDQLEKAKQDRADAFIKLARRAEEQS